MKIGFTDINRNVYGLKKKNKIGFGQSNSISQKTTVVQNNSDDKKKSDKLNTAGKVALAITVPTVLVGGAFAAYYISKGKKKNVNGSKIAPKIEKEIEQKITKNDLLKNTKEVSAILRAFSSSKDLKLTKENVMKASILLSNFEKTLYKIFDKNIASKICQNLEKIETKFSDFLTPKNEDEVLKIDTTLKKSANLALKDINSFMNILKKYDNMESVKNALQKISEQKKSRTTTQEIKREQAHILQNDAQISANVINSSQDFNYNFAGKNINNAEFVLDSQNKKYLIFDTTSAIIPQETKKKQSGFIVDGNGDTRFFAIALDEVSTDNLLGMIKNENVLKQFDSDNASQEAQDFLFNTLNELEPAKMVEALGNNKALSSTKVLSDYTKQQINITGDNIDTIVEEFAQNNNPKLTLLLASPTIAKEEMPKIMVHLYNEVLDDKNKTLIQDIITNIEQSSFKDDYQNVIHQLKNINAIRDLKASAPTDLLNKYQTLYDLNKDKLGYVDGDKKLVIFNDGHVEAISENDILTNPDALFTIQATGLETSIVDLQDPEIIYQAGNRISNTEINHKLVFKYNYNNAIDQIKCFSELSGIFDIAMVKPILYEMKEALSIPIQDEKQNESSIKLRKDTKQKVENLLVNFDDLKESDKAQALKDLCKDNLDSLNIKIDYEQKDLDELLGKQHLIDNNTAKSFMDKFVLAKFGTNFVKPVYKEIVKLDGQKMSDIGFDIQDILDDVNENLKNKPKSKSLSLNSAYKYTLSDGSSYNIETFNKFSANGKNYRITSSKNESLNMDNPQGLSNLVTNISNDPILETLFVYNLDTKEEKQNYFKAKIANALKSDNWADDVQNIIHTMYSLDLLSHTRMASNGEGTITGAKEVYEGFLNNNKGTPNILYIKSNGDILVHPNEETKPKCYVLSLG